MLSSIRYQHYTFFPFFFFFNDTATTEIYTLSLHDALPIYMAAVAAYLHGDSTLPAPRLAGTLGLGDTPDDQRGWRLEHGTLGAGLRVSPQLGANIVMGWHDSDPAQDRKSGV